MATRKIIEEVKDSSVCLSCGKSKKADDYYNSNSSFFAKNLVGQNKKMPFCKDCVSKKFDEILDEVKVTYKAVYIMCGLLDIPYKKAIFDMAQKSGRILCGEYIKFANSRKEYKSMTFINSDDMSGSMSSDDELSKLRLNWGEGFSYEEYQNLEYRYNQLIEEKGTPDFAKADSYRKFILASVVYDRDINSEESKDRTAANQNYYRALKEAGLNGKQLSDTDKQLSAGEIIMKYENHSPVLNLEDHVDIDKFTDVKDSIIKHLNRIFSRS